jgi:integrase/recombinase XerC
MGIDDFLYYLEFERRYSNHTILAYSKDLCQFEEFFSSFNDKKSISEANHNEIRLWIVDLVKNKVSTRTVNRKIVALRSYFKFCIRKGILKSNPVDKITPLKEKKRLPLFLEQNKMSFLLDDIFSNDSFEAKRDRLIIEMFYFTGMRLSELVNIRIPDLNLKAQQLRVIGKRNKERMLPIHHDLLISINQYLNVRGTQNPQTDKLFITEKGKDIYQKLVYLIVNKYLSLATTIEKRSPHVLRHTFATHMLNNGAEINNIKEILGHANLAATQVYTHNTFEKLKAVYKKAHPRT